MSGGTAIVCNALVRSVGLFNFHFCIVCFAGKWNWGGGEREREREREKETEKEEERAVKTKTAPQNSELTLSHTSYMYIILPPYRSASYSGNLTLAARSFRPKTTA